MRKDLTKILNKLYAVEIIKSPPFVEEPEYVDEPPEPPKPRSLELWEILRSVGSYADCDCIAILKNNRIPAITIYGTTQTGYILPGSINQVFRPIYSSISIHDLEAAFNTNQMQNFLAARICEKYNAPQDPQKAKEVLNFIDEWFSKAALGLNEDEIEQLPTPWLFDDGIWDLLGRLGENQTDTCIDNCLGMVHDLFTKLVSIAREAHGIELAFSVPSLDPKGVQRPDPFWGAKYPAMKTVMEKIINCVQKKLKRVIQEGTIA